MFQNYPFQRLVVYNSVSETTYIHWDLHSSMNDPGPYLYQLQGARTPNAADEDWEDLGMQETDAPFLTDDTMPSYGYVLDKYYRIILTTGRGRYVSNAFGVFGQLKASEWKLAKEIRRKERLRYGYTAVPVTILKKKRYGEPCPNCTSAQSPGSSNSQCEYCFGTGYLGGYHTPFRMQMMDISPSRLKEVHYSNSIATFNTAEDRYQARAAGVPELNAGDIVIDHSTDQRFTVVTAPVIAQLHRVPLVRQIDMNLLPYSDAAYQIPKGAKQAAEGCGAVLVNQDYGETSGLCYSNSKGDAVAGATVKILNSDEEILFKTKTGTDGVWKKGFMLDPGSYFVEFQASDDLSPTRVILNIPVSEAAENPRYVEEQKKEQIDYLNPFR